ncbi:MAG: alpha/beta hydrolase [Myxococcales bacterium]|nr:alpha/beta hydrolase [Myxococcales bacterium]
MSGSQWVERWRARGRTVRVGPHEVFVVDEGEGPCVLVLHGFPTSGYDWSAVLPELTKRRRVIVADMPGYGLSSKPEAYSYSLEAQADVMLELWAKLGVSKGHLVAHDMGTSVACAMLARREKSALPVAFESVTLSNGSVFIEMAKLTPSQRLLRHPVLGPLFASAGSRAVFGLQLRRIFGRAGSVPAEELDAMWELLCAGDGRKRLPAIIRYIDERYEKAGVWLPPLGRLELPSLILWGERDPVAVMAIGERLAREIPGAELVRLDRVGHYPMVEDPGRFASALNAFFARVER